MHSSRQRGSKQKPLQKIHPISDAVSKRQQQKRMTEQKFEEIEKSNDTDLAQMQVGMEYKNKWRMKDTNDELYPLNCDTMEFAQFGVGLALFFNFIKSVGLAFFIMALIASVSLYSNYTGNGLEQNYDQEASIYNRLSLANQPQLVLTYQDENTNSQTDEEIQEINEKATKKYVDDMKQRENYVILPDLGYTFVFLVFIVYWKSQSKKIKHEGSQTKSTPSYYTVYVQNIPKFGWNEQKLKDKFSYFGKVCEVSFVRDFQGTLLNYKTEAAIRKKISIEQKRLQLDPKRSQKKLNKLENKLSNVQDQLNKKNADTKTIGTQNFGVIGAYVVFNEKRAKVQCLKTFQKASGICAHKPPVTLIENKLLKVRGKVDEPSNIKWEYLDATPGQIFGRRFCVVLMLLGIMFLTFTVIFIANFIKPTNSNNCPQTEITYETALQNKDDNQIVECYCKQISPQEIYQDEQQKQFCWDSYIKFLTIIFLTVAFGLVVMIVNYLLKVVLRKMGNFSKYPTITSETLGVTFYLFISMFINTALITLLFSADIYGFIPAIAISEPIPPLQELQQEKSQNFNADFDRSWYVEVGAKIVYAMMFNIFIPHITFLILLPCFRRSRNKKAKKAIIQKDMNENMLGPEYTLTQYYAIVLNTIFVTLFYSSGIPLLLWFAVLSLTVQYWVYKYMLLRYNKRPPSYDHKLNKKIIKILPYAAILHLMIGIYMYSSPLIFPQSEDSVKSEVSNNLSKTDSATNLLFKSTGSQNEIQDRVTSQTYMFALLVSIVLILIIDKTVGNFIYKIKKCICSKNKEIEEPISKFPSYEEEFQDINQRMLASYDIKLNPNYTEIINAIDRVTTKKVLQQEFDIDHEVDTFDNF